MLSILMNWLLLPEADGVPRRNAPKAFQSFSNDGVSPWNPTVLASASGLRAVTPGSKWNAPRGPSPSSGCQWFIRWWTKSKPNRMSCDPFAQVALALAVYDWSLRYSGFQPSGLPRSEKPEMYMGGMPLSRGSGPLVPGMPSTSEPKLV